MIWTVTLDRNQKPTEEQIEQIEEAAERLYLMKILLNLCPQWKRHSGQRQKIVTYREN